MCGIFGVISKSISIDEKIIIASRDIMAHRGPDDSGIYISPDKTAALAHRRLSILDLTSAAHQPMTIDNRYTIVFNGEVYNYRDLKNRLTTHKNKIQSSSDTEVLLDLYAEYGIDCIKMLRGMFAFAIWDDKEKILFAARDRFGIKPFYYYNNGSQFIFSSELKAIKHYKKDLTISNEGIDAFLRTGSVPAPLTIYKEVKSLLPGHYLVISDKKMVISEYWNFNNLFSENSSLVTHHSSLITDSSSLKTKYDDEAKKKIRTALLNSVSAHMVADVEVGAFLSGGIDSTAIVSLMRQVGQEKIKTINISFPGNKLDEAVYARKASDFYSTANYEYNLTEHEVIEELDKIFYSMDQPTIDGINTYFVSKAARELGLNVVLSGVGGDELFGGYPSFINIPKYHRIKNIPFAKSFMKAAAPLLKSKLPAKAIEYMLHPDAQNAEYKLVRGLFTDSELKSLGWTCHPELSLPRLVGVESSVISKRAGESEKSSLHHSPFNTEHLTLPLTDHSSLITISELETTHYMRSQLLRDSDVFSMAHSLELRVPFVDHLLYETVLPYLDSGFDKINPKKMLVDAVGDLPEEITHRSKMGFTFPFADWIKNGEFKNLMIESIKNLDNTFTTDHLLPTIDKLHWSRLWALYVLSRFV